MKSSLELANATFASSADLARTAASIKRLASTVENQLKADFGLTDKEKKALQDAVTVMRKLGKAHVDAADIKARKVEHEKAQRRRMADLLGPTFGQLPTTADKVALIAAVHGRTATDGFQLRDLAYLLDQALDSLNYRLLNASGKGSLEQRAEEAWERFKQNRINLQEKHKGLIDRLEAEQATAGGRVGASA